MRSRWATGAGWLLAVSLSAAASTLGLDGRFDDSGNAALVGSDLGAPSFASPAEAANAVALFSFPVPSGPGGAASVLQSNHARGFSTGGDVDDGNLLPAADHTVSLGVFAKQSLAQDTGSGTLADGFAALGSTSLLGNAGYATAIHCDGDGGTVPEPGPFALLALLPLVLGAMRRRD